MEKDLIIALQNISVSFDGQPVLKDLHLSIRNQEFVTLLGPSGCGKTTTLRIIAGFLEPDAGEIFFDGQKINGLPPHKRQVNTIFQRYALFPHLNVWNNVAFGLKLLRIPKVTPAQAVELDELRVADPEKAAQLEARLAKNTRYLTWAEINQRVADMLHKVNLAGFEGRSVSSLSGGQQQRVAIARALAVQPRVLLLDEPLGALDLKLRKDMQVELKNIQQQLGITFIYVTHDQEEALSMSDTIVVMDAGEIQQIGTPKDIYDEPKNAFVADFIGESNILDGVMPDDYLVRFAGVSFACVDKGFAKNERVDVVIRPEDIDIVPPTDGCLRGVVTGVTFKGVHYEFIVDVQGFKWMIQSTDVQAVGDIIGISIKPEEIHIMKKSRYSELVGDYSCFSDEFEALSNPHDADGEEEEAEADE
ncbi:MAG: ABC transporter ATP-binding protein [Oscillospiraceae bacterium]|nr:ABC transporter ATP-binding protein [Oscillospiraceae bacterium]